MPKPEKILIIGLGSIGRRYARLLPGLGKFELYALRSGKGAACPGVKDLYSWAEVKKVSPEVAFITNPTSLHISTAIKCARLGMHLFIEKPLDMRLEGLAELKKIVKERKLSSYVAYNLRFHPGILDLKAIVEREGFSHAEVRCSSWLPDWRPGTDYRKSYSANSKLGGGVVLDLSHETDYAEYIFGAVSSIKGTARRYSGVTVDSEDTADMALRLKKGGSVDVHVDYCTRRTERTIKAATKKGFYELDLVLGRLFSSGGKDKAYAVDRDLTYIAELEYFFSRLGKKMMNDLDEAAGLLEKLVKFKRANGFK